MALPGHATIADSDGSVKGRLDRSEGVLTATVTLDSTRKIRTRPRTYGLYAYPSGLGGVALPPAWVFGRVYALDRERRRRARHVADQEPTVAPSGRLRPQALVPGSAWDPTDLRDGAWPSSPVVSALAS
jgi:hypothetical protein